MLLPQSSISGSFQRQDKYSIYNFTSNCRTDRFGGHALKSAQLTGYGVDLIGWCIQHNIDYADLAFPVRQTHSADDILAKFMQYGIDRRGGIHIFNDYCHYGNAVFCHKNTSFNTLFVLLYHKCLILQKYYAIIYKEISKKVNLSCK